jgi:hypothetical protein
VLLRWARIGICTLAVSTVFLVGTLPATAAAHRVAGGPALSLSYQTPSVTPAQPWFTLALSVANDAGAVGDLHVSVTVYSRIDNTSQLEQATGATPDKTELTRPIDVPVTATSGGHSAITCVTVMRDADDTPPAPAPGTIGACPAGAPTVTLGCTPNAGECGDVYPVSVALYRKGSGTPLTRFTTFLTYQESGAPGSVGSGGPLRVAFIVPFSTPAASTLSAPSEPVLRRVEQLAGTLTSHHGVPVTLAVSPAMVSALVAHGGRGGARAVAQLADLAAAPIGDQLLEQPYVPVDLASLSGAGLKGEIPAQLARGAQLLRLAGLHPTDGSWVDAASDFTSGDSGDLADGLQAVDASHLVVDDSDLAAAGPEEYTFAQPFTLTLGHGVHVAAAGANSQVDSRFDADAGDPALAANQLLAALEWIHFENASLGDPRGVVVVPPASWQPSADFASALLNGMTNNPALSPVTLDQYFTQVPQGGNNEPGQRHLQSGSSSGATSITAASAQRIRSARADLNSFSAAVGGHPAALTELSNLLLTTESQNFDPVQRTAALTSYTRQFENQLGSITIASERTVTFTSRTAAIPVTVLSSAPYPVTVVLTLTSDKFKFPHGSTRTLVLRRPTTPVRVQAEARTSGDRLPVTVTLRTADGELTIAHTVLTVHSTSLSIVAIILTLLAGGVLLVWWARTWRKGRRHRPRAH